MSTVPDDTDPDTVSPSDWNDDHTVSLTAADVGAEDAGAVAAHTGDATDAHDASAISVDSTTLVGTGTDVQAVLEELDDAIAAAGAPANADYLVGSSNGTLSNEIVVGTTPGGELGGSWASPTVDATHSGSAHHDAATEGTGIDISGQVISVDLSELSAGGELGGTLDAPTVDATHSGSTHAATQAAAEATAASALSTHAGAADPHTGYLKESDFTGVDFLVGTATGITASEIAVGTSPGGELGGTWASPTVDATHSGSTHSAATDTHIADSSAAHAASAVSVDSTTLAGVGTDVQAVLEELDDAIAAGSGAPADATYLTTTANGTLSAEVVVGTSPGGELGGTWASPTVDATHSGSAHHTQSHDHASAGDGTSLSPATLVIPGATSPAQTAEGSAVWDSDDDKLTVGTGAARKTLMNTDTSVLAAQMPALTGDVTTSAGAVATSIANNAVTLAKMATQADQTFLGNISGSTAVPSALTVTQVLTALKLQIGGTPYVVWSNTPDGTITADAGLNADAALLTTGSALVASGVYWFEVYAAFTGANSGGAAATADILVGFSFPTSPTAVQWGAFHTPSTNMASWGPAGTGGTPTTLLGAGAVGNTSGQAGALSIGGFAGTLGVGVGGWIVNGANAGDITFLWSQNTSNAATLQRDRGMLRVWRIA